MKRKPTADDVRKVAIAALTTALDDGKREARDKPGLTGMRAVATGAVLYTAGRAAVGGSRFLRERLGAESNGRADDDERDESEDEEYDEPEAESEEDYEDEEEEPEAESDEDFEDEDEEEPEAESDEDFEEEDEDEEPRRSGGRRAVRSRSASSDALPERPSRSRSPVGRS